MVAGNVGGIPLQITDGETGYLVNTVEECAARMVHLLQNPVEADRMGAVGREHVRHNFLTTRYLRDYLQLFTDLSSGASSHTTRPVAADFRMTGGGGRHEQGIGIDPSRRAG